MSIDENVSEGQRVVLTKRRTNYCQKEHPLHVISRKFPKLVFYHGQGVPQVDIAQGDVDFRGRSLSFEAKYQPRRVNNKYIGEVIYSIEGETSERDSAVRFSTNIIDPLLGVQRSETYRVDRNGRGRWCKR